MTREGVGPAGDVDDDRVVDDEVDRDERVDRVGPAAERRDGVAHRGEVDDRGDAGEVLQQDPSRREGDLLLAGAGRAKFGERLDVAAGDVDAVLVAQQVLEEHLQREGQVLDVVVGLQRRQTVDGVVAPADGKPALGAEAVLSHVDLPVIDAKLPVIRARFTSGDEPRSPGGPMLRPDVGGITSPSALLPS